MLEKCTVASCWCFLNSRLLAAQVSGTMAELNRLLDDNPPCPDFRPLEVQMPERNRD